MNSTILRAVLRFTYKYYDEGHIRRKKLRFNYLGNRVKFDILYDPKELAVYAADIASLSLRLVFVLSVRLSMLLLHVDFTAAFLHEDYDGPTTLYLQPISDCDGNYRHPGMITKVPKNIYRKPNSLRIFTEGLRRHLSGIITLHA